jgi:hypothetical protein
LNYPAYYLFRQVFPYPSSPSHEELMISTSIPAKFALVWAANANSAFIRSIPTTSQIGITNGAASLNDGFPPLTFTPETAGGTPPFGQDFNGIFNEITKIQQWQQAGGNWIFDSAFATAVGGYPANAMIESSIVPGRMWLNTVDNNAASPDVFPFTGWTALPGHNPPGTPVPSFSATVLPGHVLANGQTIGNAGSGGTTAPSGLASATAFFLFCAIWRQFPQTTCPVQFNGAPVTRGANPNADWVAGRVISLPQMGGSGIIGQDSIGGVTTSQLTGVPVNLGTLTTPGSWIGLNSETLTATQIPAISSSGGGLGVSVSVSGGVSVSTQTGNAGMSNTAANTQALIAPLSNPVSFAGSGSFSGSGSGSTSGQSVVSNNTGGQSHNNAQLSWTVAWNLAL